MRLLNAEPQSCCIVDLETWGVSDHYYLILKASDANVAFLICQATESRQFMDQDLQDIVQE